MGEGRYVHLRIYVSFSNEVTLSGIQEGKAKNDPIDYFDPNL